MSAVSSIVLYDIATRPPVEKTACSPNPWKARMALNFKGLPYSTKWIGLPDIPKVRSSLNVPPTRKFADGSDFYTLPILEDPATEAPVGDSFDIAVHLQRKYPDAGAGDLFPPQNLDYALPHDLPLLIPLSEIRGGDFPDYARFNMHVDAAFTAHVILTIQGFPFHPDYEEATKAIFIQRAGVPSFDVLIIDAETRRKTMDSFEKMLGGLAKMFQRDTSGPFLLGTKASYADLCVGAWLQMLHVTLPQNELDELRGWHDGLWGKLHDALDVYAEVK